jgi:hypothetical protein
MVSTGTAMLGGTCVVDLSAINALHMRIKGRIHFSY